MTAETAANLSSAHSQADHQQIQPSSTRRHLPVFKHQLQTPTFPRCTMIAAVVHHECTAPAAAPTRPEGTYHLAEQRGQGHTVNAVLRSLRALSGCCGTPGTACAVEKTPKDLERGCVVLACDGVSRSGPDVSAILAVISVAPSLRRRSRRFASASSCKQSRTRHAR